MVKIAVVAGADVVVSFFVAVDKYSVTVCTTAEEVIAVVLAAPVVE